MNRALLFYIFLVTSSFTVQAAGPSVWSINSRAEIVKGNARGVSIEQDGALTLAPRLTEVFKTEQSYIWASVIDRTGNVYLGTG